ncbi:MAG: hypothetical protein FJ399_20980 [Verrucomicrobia bacterium]|nr:hypothetical protein [Verrucomicrobiota bacterium]
MFGLGAVAWWGVGSREVEVVHAGEGSSIDSDGDGLHDALELVIGTNPNRLDTDGDGFGDGEEVARSSNPRRKQVVPASADAGVSIDAYAENGRVHALTTIYLPPEQHRARSLQFGIEHNDALLGVPLGALRGGEMPRTILLNDGARLVVIDPVVPAAFAHARGGLTMFVTVANGAHYLAAGSMSLTVIDGELFEHVRLDSNALASNSLQTTSVQGGVFRPLTAGGSGTSASQFPGRICAQSTMVLGVVGALVTQEVVDAGCVEGWDAHCTPGCAATVGMTIKTIDPAALIGG